MLERGDAVLCERYSWSGLAYSGAVYPTKDILSLCALDMGLVAPDVVSVFRSRLPGKGVRHLP